LSWLRSRGSSRNIVRRARMGGRKEQTSTERANGNNHRAPAAVTECYMLGNIRSGGWCPTERGNMICPKCGIRLIKERICCKCGTYIYPENFTPIVKREFVPEGNKTRIGTCENCNRPDLFLHGGLCGSCAAAVKPINGRKIVRNSTEYQNRLRYIRERIQKGGPRYENQNKHKRVFVNQASDRV
jgi:hypothetical protein